MNIAALGMSLILVGTAAPAVADEGAPTPGAVLEVSEASAVLTLPAGDGVRDTTTFTVTSDVATTVALHVLGTDDTSVVKTLPQVELTSDALSVSVQVGVADLPAGLLSLRATPTEGEAASSALLVGSGKPSTVNLSISPKTIYTWNGSPARSTVATVSAVDETELAIPFTGSVAATVGSVKQVVPVSSPAGSATKATISASKLKAGAGTIIATVTGNGKRAASDALSLTVRKTTVTSAKVTRSATAVYPTRDDYMDNVKFSVSWKSSTGGTIPTTGTVKIVNSKGKTVKSWSKSSSKPWAVTWNGKIGSAAVYGTYTVKVAVKGPEGSTLTSSTKVTVKKGKLVDRTLKSTVKANTVLTQYVDLGDWDYNVCYENYYRLGDIFCDGDDSIDGISVLSTGKRTVPAAVKSAQKYGGAKVRMTAKVTSLYGDAAWGYARKGAETSKTTVIRSVGKSTPGWLSLPETTSKLDVFLGLGEYSFVGIDTFTIEYRYKVLSTK